MSLSEIFLKSIDQRLLKGTSALCLEAFEHFFFLFWHVFKFSLNKFLMYLVYQVDLLLHVSVFVVVTVVVVMWTWLERWESSEIRGHPFSIHTKLRNIGLRKSDKKYLIFGKSLGWSSCTQPRIGKWALTMKALHFVWRLRRFVEICWWDGWLIDWLIDFFYIDRSKANASCSLSTHEMYDVIWHQVFQVHL